MLILGREQFVRDNFMETFFFDPELEREVVGGGWCVAQQMSAVNCTTYLAAKIVQHTWLNDGEDIVALFQAGIVELTISFGRDVDVQTHERYAGVGGAVKPHFEVRIIVGLGPNARNINRPDLVFRHLFFKKLLRMFGDMFDHFGIDLVPETEHILGVCRDRQSHVYLSICWCGRSQWEDNTRTEFGLRVCHLEAKGFPISSTNIATEARRSAHTRGLDRLADLHHIEVHGIKHGRRAVQCSAGSRGSGGHHHCRR